MRRAGKKYGRGSLHFHTIITALRCILVCVWLAIFGLAQLHVQTHGSIATMCSWMLQAFVPQYMVKAACAIGIYVPRFDQFGVWLR